MKLQAYKRNFDSETLIVAIELIQPEGFNIVEKCYPAIWFTVGYEPKIEMVPVSHPFFSDADKAPNWDLGHAIEHLGGRDKLESMITSLLQELKYHHG